MYDVQCLSRHSAGFDVPKSYRCIGFMKNINILHPKFSFSVLQQTAQNIVSPHINHVSVQGHFTFKPPFTLKDFSQKNNTAFPLVRLAFKTSKSAQTTLWLHSITFFRPFSKAIGCLRFSSPLVGCNHGIKA